MSHLASTSGGGDQTQGVTDSSKNVNPHDSDTGKDDIGASPPEGPLRQSPEELSEEPTPNANNQHLNAQTVDNQTLTLPGVKPCVQNELSMQDLPFGGHTDIPHTNAHDRAEEVSGISIHPRVSGRTKTFTEKGLAYQTEICIKRLRSALRTHKQMCENYQKFWITKNMTQSY
jgi:hypothetical protein